MDQVLGQDGLEVLHIEACPEVGAEDKGFKMPFPEPGGGWLFLAFQQRAVGLHPHPRHVRRPQAPKRVRSSLDHQAAGQDVLCQPLVGR